MPGTIQVSLHKSALDTLIVKVSCADEKLRTVQEELWRLERIYPGLTMRPASIQIKDLRSELLSASREAHLATMTEQPTSGQTKLNSTLNDTLVAILGNARQTAASTATIVLLLERLGKDLETGTDG